MSADPGAPAGRRLIEPELPFAMQPRIRRALADERLLHFVDAAAEIKYRGRLSACREAFGERYDALRAHAGALKRHTLANLDSYLETFIARASAQGTVVHAAADGAEANAICLEIARRHGVRRCVKSKSMVTEETGLLPALEAAGIETVETDLGEFIVQLDGDAPSHIVTPMIHKDRATAARAMQRELGAAYDEDPERLTEVAREHLREKFRHADLGVSGANFLVAETGTLVLCTNEGNGGLSVSAPPVHVALVGIEKLIPRLEHLSVFLKLLARSATAQPQTVYTTLLDGPRRPSEHDGPEEVHVILVDNGRTRLLGEPDRELLACIRCGACLNACPVFRKAGGGHAYGAVYSGPIGAALTPLLRGLANYPDLPRYCALCGACGLACPVDIDLPAQLIRLRSEQVSQGLTGRWERWLYRCWARCLSSPFLFALTSRLQRTFLRRLGRRNGGWISRAPGFLGRWTRERDLPAPPATGFRHWWRQRERGEAR